MRWCVLGPVRLVVDGRDVDLGPAKQRCVLASLLLTPGQVVPLATLVDRVWGERPPRAANAVAPYVARLRRILGTVGGPEIRFVSGGYRIDADPGPVDLHQARSLTRRARAARDTGDHARTAELLAEALACWHAVPLAGLPGAWAERVRETLHREHLDLHAALAEANRRLGRYEEVVERLDPLVAEHPTAEELIGPLMNALAASGRGAQALDRYAKARAAIAEELGSEPSAELQGLHLTILRSAGPVTSAPAQLPPAAAAYTGRAFELSHLDELLAGPGALIGIWGPPGVGKTALAVHWAHRVRSRFPDGQIYLNLRGFDPAGSMVSPADAVRHLLDAVGVTGRDVPADLDARVGLMRTRFADLRALVLLDNAREADQVRPLLPGGAGCVVVVTSRNRLTSLVAADGAQPVDLGLLAAGDARTLFARRLGSRRVRGQEGAVDRLIGAGSLLPIALVTIAARAAMEPSRPLATLADELASGGRQLDGLSAGDAATDVRTVFSWSYRALSAPAARLFRLLGVHPGPDIGRRAVAVLAEHPDAEMSELVTAHLVAVRGSDRYGMHDLLRSYAAELAGDGERRAAVRRLLDHYLYTSDAAGDVIAPARTPVELDPSPVEVRRFADPDEALAWFGAEHAVLMDAVRVAAELGFDRHAWQLAATLANYLDFRGHWEDWIAVQLIGVEATVRLGDRAAEARAHRVLGRAYAQVGRYDDAEPQYHAALDTYAAIGDDAGRAHTHFSLSWMCEERGRNAEALRHTEQALRFYRRAGHEVGEARTLNALGWDLALAGDFDAALRYCHEAVTLQQKLGDAYGEACAWDSLGYARHHLGDHRLAIDHFRRSLQLHQQDGDLGCEAEVLVHLGDSYHAAGDFESARAQWQRAHRILTDLSHPDAAEVLAKLAGLD